MGRVFKHNFTYADEAGRNVSLVYEAEILDVASGEAPGGAGGKKGAVGRKKEEAAPFHGYLIRYPKWPKRPKWPLSSLMLAAQ